MRPSVRSSRASLVANHQPSHLPPRHPPEGDGRPKGFAFVTMENKDDAEEAVRKLSNTPLDGRDIRVPRISFLNDLSCFGPSDLSHHLIVFGGWLGTTG